MSLAELLIAAVIVAALVGVAVPFFQDNLSEAQGTKVAQDLEVIRKAIALRGAHTGPAAPLADLGELAGSYLAELPADPWGRPYAYDPATGQLSCLGADGLPGGSGGDTDRTLATSPGDPAARTWLAPPPVPAEVPARGAPLPRSAAPPVRPMVSTFGLDVDTASFTLARAWLARGRLPPAAAMRPEEFVAALDPGLPGPVDGRAFAIHGEAAPDPVDPAKVLLRIGIQARRPAPGARPPQGVVLVVDVSGSMADPGRFDLARHLGRELVRRLGPGDRMALVDFAEDARLVTGPRGVGDRAALEEAIDSLVIRGGTDVSAGLACGYAQARAMRAGPGPVRVLVVSDGMANTGITDPDALVARVRADAGDGIELTTIGVGMGESSDAMMETLADRGNGRCRYLDSPAEATRAAADELGLGARPQARDARAQVEFDPAAVRSWRLVGFENRAMPTAAFASPTADAGELAEGHAVAVLYELELVPGASGVALGRVRLGWKPAGAGSEEPLEFLEVELPRASGLAPASPSLRGTALAAGLAEALRDRTFAGTPEWARVEALARGLAVPSGSDGGLAALLDVLEGVRRALG